MSIENRNLESRMTLVATHKKEQYQAEVVTGDGGKVQIEFPDGRLFKSPSAAGTAITGTACNGWRFWTTMVANGQANQEDATTVAEPEPEVTTEQPGESQPGIDTPADGADGEDGLEDQETNQEPPRFRRVANQNGLAVGEERIFCDACGSGFVVLLGEQPDQCTKGHAPQARSNWAKK